MRTKINMTRQETQKTKIGNHECEREDTEHGEKRREDPTQAKIHKRDDKENEVKDRLP